MVTTAEGKFKGEINKDAEKKNKREQKVRKTTKRKINTKQKFTKQKFTKQKFTKQKSNAYANANDEKVVKSTNIMAIKKKGMNSELRSLSHDFFDLFSPYCVLFYVNKLKNLIELNKKLKELSYKYTTFIYVQNNRLLYNIMSNYTKLSLTFQIQSFTNSSVIKSKYSKDEYFNFKKLKPLLILKNFNNGANCEMENYLVITRNILKNLYPCVNLNNDFTNKPRRIILYCYNNMDETIYFRQYVVNVKRESFKKLLNEAYKQKNISEYYDIYNYVSNNIDMDKFINDKESKMIEIGPRVSFKIFKIADQDKGIHIFNDGKKVTFKSNISDYEE
ncbi:BRIX domain, putative [Plasmodium malariae]|uniref:BRIX domain, putative n=1 Tax=Plasmodium malariae TaxID=5858 RepID=A0A1C3KLR4_PLAMA|nr:BRIX domain, putative [Plasmodium malariae]